MTTFLRLRLRETVAISCRALGKRAIITQGDYLIRLSSQERRVEENAFVLNRKGERESKRG